MAKAKHPRQRVDIDPHGTLRFRPNAIVQYLLKNGPFDMNHIAVKGFPLEDQEQFAQLIGYSVSGAADLSYVKPQTIRAARREAGLDKDGAA